MREYNWVETTEFFNTTTRRWTLDNDGMGADTLTALLDDPNKIRHTATANS